MNGFPSTIYIRARVVIEHLLSKKLCWVPIIMSRALQQRTNKVACIRLYYSLKRIERKVKFVGSASPDWFLILANTLEFACVLFVDVFLVVIATLFQCAGKNFVCIANISQFHRLVNDVPSNPSTVKFGLSQCRHTRVHRYHVKIKTRCLRCYRLCSLLFERMETW